MFDARCSPEAVRGVTRRLALGAPGHGESANEAAAAEVSGWLHGVTLSPLRRRFFGARSLNDSGARGLSRRRQRERVRRGS